MELNMVYTHQIARSKTPFQNVVKMDSVLCQFYLLRYLVYNGAQLKHCSSKAAPDFISLFTYLGVTTSFLLGFSSTFPAFDKAHGFRCCYQHFKLSQSYLAFKYVSHP